jgi:hypothetical protein
MDHLIMIYEFYFHFYARGTCISMAASFVSTDYQPEVNSDGCKNKVEMCGMVDYLS